MHSLHGKHNLGQHLDGIDVVVFDIKMSALDYTPSSAP